MAQRHQHLGKLQSQAPPVAAACGAAALWTGRAESLAEDAQRRLVAAACHCCDRSAAGVDICVPLAALTRSCRLPTDRQYYGCQGRAVNGAGSHSWDDKLEGVVDMREIIVGRQTTQNLNLRILVETDVNTGRCCP
jgi:hypothetical protein